MQKEITDIKAFLSGHKPAFLYNQKEKPWFYEEDEVQALKKYPLVQVDVELAQNQTLYFQCEQERRDFIQRTQDLIMNSPSWLRELGLVLGYPPKAVDFYVALKQDPALESQAVGIHFNGIGCTGNIDIIENVCWLWERYPSSWFQQDVEISYKKGWYTIPYGDLVTLKRVEQQIKTGASLLHR